MSLKFSKPTYRKGSKHRCEIKGVKRLPDGREICDKTSAGRAELKRRRLAVYEMHNGICYLCGKFVHWEDYELEHRIPKGHGGATHDDRLENLAVSHSKCNSEKGSKRL